MFMASGAVPTFCCCARAGAAHSKAAQAAPDRAIPDPTGRMAYPPSIVFSLANIARVQGLFDAPDFIDAARLRNAVANV
jgi:hypothetical protein